MITENNLRLDNKTIVVTGASGHIGSSISSSLSMLGADLILVDIDKEKLSKLSNNIKNQNPANIKIIKADLSKPKAGAMPSDLCHNAFFNALIAAFV